MNSFVECPSVSYRHNPGPAIWDPQCCIELVQTSRKMSTLAISHIGLRNAPGATIPLPAGCCPPLPSTHSTVICCSFSLAFNASCTCLLYTSDAADEEDSVDL